MAPFHDKPDTITYGFAKSLDDCTAFRGWQLKHRIFRRLLERPAAVYCLASVPVDEGVSARARNLLIETARVLGLPIRDVWRDAYAAVRAFDIDHPFRAPPDPKPWRKRVVLANRENLRACWWHGPPEGSVPLVLSWPRRSAEISELLETEYERLVHRLFNDEVSN